MADPAPPLAQPSLEALIAKFDPSCGGLPLEQAVNLIGRLFGLVYDDGAINVNTSGGGGEQTFAITSHVGDTTVTAGATLVEFHLSDDFTGSIDGVAYSGADWISVGPFVAAAGKTLDAIAVVRTAGTIKIVKIS
jgi:hypothetical protein